MNNRILIGVLVFCLGGQSLAMQSVTGDREIDIVVNNANILSSLTLEDARRIFRGEKTSWQGGKRITVLMLSPGQPERTVMLRRIYEMSESEYTKYFLQAAFTGRVQGAPREIATPSQMKTYLAASPGAIGYLKKQDVDASVKVLLAID